jgi:hypothetical protein
MTSRFFNAFILANLSWKSNGQPERFVVFQHKAISNANVPQNIAQFCFPEKLSSKIAFKPR